MENSTKKTQVKKNNEEILDTPLYINWFGVYSECGQLMERPKQENSCVYPDFDQDVKDGQEYYDTLNKAVIFPDFYEDDKIGIVTLLRNDNLEITLTVLNIDKERHVEFIEAKTIGELLLKFPLLKQYVNDKVISKLSSRYYHPSNDLA